MRISVVGNGYVGFAGNGYQSICIDNNPAKVDSVNQGKTPVHENGLGDLVSSYLCKYRSLRVSPIYNYHGICW
jgi:UDP-glucose 6-dehydrogenase